MIFIHRRCMFMQMRIGFWLGWLGILSIGGPVYFSQISGIEGTDHVQTILDRLT